MSAARVAAPAGGVAFTRHAVRVALLFGGAGLVSRFVLRTTETRWQIVAFWAAVAAYQLGLRPAFGRRVSVASLGLDMAVVAAAIVAMKVAIEGQL